MTPLSVHVLNATHKLPPKPSRFRRLLWVCGEVIAALLVNLLAIIVPVAIYLVMS
jgi:hypothetical protein